MPFWYCDDGQAICRPEDVDLLLECLDAAAANVGATRGEGSDVKSFVRLVGHADALAVFDQEWVTDRISRTCKIGAPNAHCEVLGAMAGPPSACTAQFRERILALQSLHQSLGEISDPAVELTLGRACANVSKVTHLLRSNGHQIDSDALALHDEAMDAFLDSTLGGELPDNALAQAALGVGHGGLGFRRASSLAKSAFVASRVEARPFVERLFNAMAAQDVLVPAIADSSLRSASGDCRAGAL